MFSKECIFCGSTNDLDTVMNVKIEDTEYTVAICENDEDYATPRAVKEAVSSQLEKQNEVDKERAELIKRAKELGLVIAEPDQVPQHASERQDETLPERSKPKKKKQPEQELKPGYVSKISASEVLKPDVAAPTSVAAQGVEWRGEGYVPYNLDREIANKDGEKARIRDEVVESQWIEKDGRQIQIPAKFEGDPGQTEITVIQVDDREIQKRFKMLNDNPIPGAYGSTRDCTMCRGIGRTKVDNNVCQKCGGRGYIG